MLATHIRETNLLPASLLKEEPNANPVDRASVTERSEPAACAPEGPTATIARHLEAETGKTEDPVAGEEAEIVGRDELYRKPLKVCWSLSTAKDFHGELPAMSQETKELVKQEQLLYFAREQEKEKYERFRA